MQLPQHCLQIFLLSLLPTVFCTVLNIHRRDSGYIHIKLSSSNLFPTASSAPFLQFSDGTAVSRTTNYGQPQSSSSAGGTPGYQQGYQPINQSQSANYYQQQGAALGYLIGQQSQYFDPHSTTRSIQTATPSSSQQGGQYGYYGDDNSTYSQAYQPNQYGLPQGGQYGNTYQSQGYQQSPGASQQYPPNQSGTYQQQGDSQQYGYEQNDGYSGAAQGQGQGSQQNQGYSSGSGYPQGQPQNYAGSENNRNNQGYGGQNSPYASSQSGSSGTNYGQGQPGQYDNSSNQTDYGYQGGYGSQGQDNAYGQQQGQDQYVYGVQSQPNRGSADQSRYGQGQQGSVSQQSPYYDASQNRWLTPEEYNRVSSNGSYSGSASNPSMQSGSPNYASGNRPADSRANTAGGRNNYGGGQSGYDNYQNDTDYQNPYGAQTYGNQYQNPGYPGQNLGQTSNQYFDQNPQALTNGSQYSDAQAAGMNGTLSENRATAVSSVSLLLITFASFFYTLLA